MTHVPPAHDALLRTLRDHRLLPVLRARDRDELRRQVDECLEAGLSVLELTTTSPGWLDVLRSLKDRASGEGLTLGVGTVISTDLATQAIDGGADFLVTPYRVDDVAGVAGDLPIVRGAFSPSELASAGSLGLAKLFPASALGPGYLKSVLEVLPGTRVIPTGGITMATARSWLDAGAVAVGMGSRLFDDGIEGIRSLRESLAE